MNNPIRAHEIVPVLLLGGVLLSFPAGAQDSPKPPSSQERLKSLEKRVADLEKELETAEKGSVKADPKEIEKEVEKFYSKGIISIGGLRFRIGGQVRVNLLDPQIERSVNPDPNGTDSPDPHMELHKLRLSPRVDFVKSKTLGEIFAKADIDFYPTKGDTLLKRATVHHEVQPGWLVGSSIKFGLDDRFIRPRKLTQNYPLLGTAFWRDQTVGLFWEGTLGNKRGKPMEAEEVRKGKKGKKGKEGGMGKAGGEESLDGEGGGADPDGEEEGADGTEGEPIPSRSSMTKSTERKPFDFLRNPGALKLHFSVTDGYGEDLKEIIREDDEFNFVLQDNRDFTDPLTLREIGLGLGYERDFRELGEVEVLGFYYNDQLGESEIDFLQENDPAYTSVEDTQYRYGANLGYHLESYHLWKALDAERLMNPRPGDGLYLFYQWIWATDGELDRKGWYFQTSFRISNPKRWKYFRTIEPVIRYGELMPRTPHDVGYPLTWARRQWLLGTIFGIAKGVFLRAEYTINKENTGSYNISNNELLVQLLLEF